MVIEVVGWVEDLEIYLVAFKCHSFEYLCEVVYLCICINIFGVMVWVCYCLVQVIYCYFYENGFLWVYMFIIIVSDCEGAGEFFCVFILDVFNLVCIDDGKVDFS